MEPAAQIVFGPFRYDHATQGLWQGQQEIRLRAWTLAVLRYLLEHPGRVIGRQEFAWPRRNVHRVAPDCWRSKGSQPARCQVPPSDPALPSCSVSDRRDGAQTSFGCRSEGCATPA
jgi:hypothetical protein